MRYLLPVHVLAQSVDLQPGTRDAVIQLGGLLITGLVSVVVAALTNRSGKRTDSRADAVLSGTVIVPGNPHSPGTPPPINGNGVAQSWRDLAREWESRYRERDAQADRLTEDLDAERRNHRQTRVELDRTMAMLAEAQAELRARHRPGRGSSPGSAKG